MRTYRNGEKLPAAVIWCKRDSHFRKPEATHTLKQQCERLTAIVGRGGLFTFDEVLNNGMWIDALVRAQGMTRIN